MRKQILVLVSMFLVAFLVTGVSALSCEISIIKPEVESYKSGDVQISWQSSNCSNVFDIDYKESSCLGEEGWTRFKSDAIGNEYLWESGMETGELCIRVIEDNNLQNKGVMEGTFFIDGIVPEANAGGPYQCDEGTQIVLNANASTDNLGPLEFWWELDGDDDFDDAFGVNPNFNCEDGNANMPIAVKAIDRAGNFDIAESNVVISNVAPICEGIIASPRGVIDSPIEFFANATDVLADMPLNYFWKFGDGSNSTSNPINHTYTSGGNYNVTVEVTDDEGASDICMHPISIVEPVELDAQEVAAYYNLEANFPSNPGEVPNSFDTGLEGEVSCVKIEGPENLQTYSDGNDCVVKWGDPNARPTNDEKGTKQVIIKANEMPFVFDVTVYSWIIPLHTGWNLISIPLVPNDTSIDRVLIDQLYDYLPGASSYPIWSYQFNGNESKWLKSRRTVSFRTLTTVEPGYSYWINVVNDTELKGFGTLTTNPEGGPNGPFPWITVPTRGWSMIGRFGVRGSLPQADKISLEDALESLIRARVDKIHLYKDESGRTIPTEELEPYEGFWLYIDRGNSNLPTETYTPLDEFYPWN